jgi:hypothetical protein
MKSRELLLSCATYRNSGNASTIVAADSRCSGFPTASFTESLETRCEFWQSRIGGNAQVLGAVASNL